MEQFAETLADLALAVMKAGGVQSADVEYVGVGIPGAVILLHSTGKTNSKILDTLLTRWKEMGYRFATPDCL